MSEMHTEVREISVEEFDEMIENHDDLLIVDVREAGEFRRGHIPGAVLLPHSLLDGAADDARRMQLEQLLGGRHKTFVLCGRDGTDSVATADRLRRWGFDKVYSLAGGIARWQAQGYALVTD
ncbi:MAG: rhodanese-like domain-containing protein [Sulfuricaulis sp.]